MIGLAAVRRDEHWDGGRRQVDRSQRRARRPSLVPRALEAARRALAPNRPIRKPAQR
jgi:hypothetical protein